MKINGTGRRATVNKPGRPPANVNRSNVGYFYIGVGQSNCGNAFYAEMTTDQQNTYYKNYANPKIYNRYLQMTAFDSLKIGVNTNSSGGEGVSNPGEFGFEASMFKELLEDYPTRSMYMLKYGHTGTSLGGYWKHNLNNLNFDKLMIAVEDAMDEIIADGKVPVLKAFFWIQGEADATTESYANAYGTNLTNFFSQFTTEYAAFRTERGLASNNDFLKVITDNYATGYAPAAYRDTIRAQKITYCDNPSNNAVFVETQDLPVIRVVHWTATGQITLGERFYDLIKNL